MPKTDQRAPVPEGWEIRPDITNTGSQIHIYKTIFVKIIGMLSHVKWTHFLTELQLKRETCVTAVPYPDTVDRRENIFQKLSFYIGKKQNYAIPLPLEGRRGLPDAVVHRTDQTSVLSAMSHRRVLVFPTFVVHKKQLLLTLNSDAEDTRVLVHKTDVSPIGCKRGVKRLHMLSTTLTNKTWQK